MGWIITTGILFLLAILPLGVSVRYNAEGLLLKLVLGPAKITLVPSKKKKPKEEKPDKKKSEKKEPKKEKKTPENNAPEHQVGADKPSAAPGQPGEEKGGSLLDFLPLVGTVFDFLGDFKNKLRINQLRLKIIMAGGDPANLGIQYGRTWAAVGNLMPLLDSWLVIKKRDVEVECDFTASSTTIIAHVELTITLGRLLAALVKFAFRALIKYLKISKKRKGGVKQ